MMLSIFSCDYLPSIYLFDHITVRVFCLLSNWVVWYFTIEGFLKSIYLAALDLSWGIQDLQSSLRHKGCFSWSIWTLSCNMWDLAPWIGTEPGTPTLGVWSLSHRTTREVPCPSPLIGGVWTGCYGWFLFCGVLYFYLDQLWFEFNFQVRKKGLITLYFM